MKLKKIFSILIWPIIFIIGQFIIEYIFVAFYNYKNMKIYKTTFNDFSDIDIINTNFYKYDLNNYLNSKALVISILIFIIYGSIFYLVYRKYIKKSKFKFNDIIKIVMLAFIIATFYNSFIFLINNVVHISDNYSSSGVPIIIQIISSGLIGPIIEELLFRGIIYNKLKEISTINKAKIYTSLLFASMHLPNVATVIYTFFLSLIFIYLYDKYKTLKASIIFHMVINITSIIMVYILLFNNILLNSLIIIISLSFLFIKSTQKL